MYGIVRYKSKGCAQILVSAHYRTTLQRLMQNLVLYTYHVIKRVKLICAEKVFFHIECPRSAHYTFSLQGMAPTRVEPHAQSSSVSFVLWRAAHAAALCTAMVQCEPRLRDYGPSLGRGFASVQVRPAFFFHLKVLCRRLLRPAV